ncbi:GPI inositol-deacylase [Asbolus verrucosus]|uniref:GPI inositol-deacylase n=1 Tax=Asbolus verrucosus TaxID=1661398 RepID=A0A482V1F6_ASBVE|nr:GPI inositol-deacylase [Asbolus verrucosus]
MINSGSKECFPYLQKSSHAHILNLSPPLNMVSHWFKDHVAYTMAKYGMSMCVLGMAEEFKTYNIGVNALWPRTAIYTAAIEMLMGNKSAKYSRKPEITADAAYAILTEDPKTTTGNFFVDEEVLRRHGVTDFDQYAIDPSNKDNLLPDSFLDANPPASGPTLIHAFKEKVQKISSSNAITDFSDFQAPADGKIPQVFRAVEANLSAETVQKTQAVFQFVVTGNEAGKWFVDLKNGKGSCGPGEAPSSPDATITTDSKNFFDMFSGKLNTPVLGLLTFISDHEENKCDMTFMFEYPQFVKIFNEIDEKYPKYGLYAYSEGRLTEKARNMYFDGIPVLFIPGNAGSYRQVRSLASVALRKAYNSRTPFHFDYFSIDLNDELSGLNGALLSEQLLYVNSSIYRVLELYKSLKNPPKSIILFGHSMGGVIARRLIASLPEDSGLVPVVLTLASPHKRPPLMLDSFSRDFYDGVEKSATLNTTIISISGGYSDFLVPSFLTSLQDRHSLHVLTTHIPRSWLVADHLCILWCKQTILTINRALFDSVDPKTRQISTDPEHRRSVFHHHLVHHSGINSHLRNNYDVRPNIHNHGEWVENLGRQYSIHLVRGVKTAHFYMVRLVNQPQHEALTVVAINLETVDWAYVCGAHIPRGNHRVCEEFTHLTHLSEITPSAKYKRRKLTINMHQLMKNNPEFTHVVLRVLPTNEPVVLNVDVYNVEERKLAVNLPHMLSFKRQILVRDTPEKAVHFELALPQLQHVIQSYQLFVDPVQCSNEMRHATASLIVPWGHQNQHRHFVDSDNKPLHVRLYDSRPRWASNQSALIRLTLDPNCRYKISIRSSIPGMLGQMARFYTPLLVTNVAAVVLMALNSQLRSISKERSCSLFFTAVQEGAKPYYILTGVKLISRFLSAKQFGFLPAPDWSVMSQEGTDFFLLPLLLYVCSVGIVWLLGVVLCGSLVVFETTVHKFALKFLAKTVSFTVSWSDHVVSALHKLPFVVAGALVGLSVTTTGSLALCVGTVFYFMRLTQLSQDYIEGLVWCYVKKIGSKFKRTRPKKEESEPSTSQNEDAKDVDKRDSSNNNNNDSETSIHDAMFFHATLFMLWCLVTVINVPSVLTWAHNFKYSTSLQPDPSFIPGLILSACALPLWQLELPKIERRWYTEIGQLISILAVVSLIYAPISIFRLNYTLTSAFVVVVLHQIAGPNRDLTRSDRQSERPNWFETIKAKLE